MDVSFVSDCFVKVNCFWELMGFYKDLCKILWEISTGENIRTVRWYFQLVPSPMCFQEPLQLRKLGDVRTSLSVLYVSSVEFPIEKSKEKIQYHEIICVYLTHLIFGIFACYSCFTPTDKLGEVSTEIPQIKSIQSLDWTHLLRNDVIDDPLQRVETRWYYAPAYASDSEFII